MSCGEWRWAFESDVRLLLSSATLQQFPSYVSPSPPASTCSCSSCSQQQRKPPVAQAEKQRKALQQGVFQAPQQTENQCYKSVAGTGDSKNKVRPKNGLHLYDKFVNQHLVLYLVTIAVETAPHAITSIKADSVTI